MKAKKSSHKLLSNTYGIKRSCNRQNVDTRCCCRLTKIALTLKSQSQLFTTSKQRLPAIQHIRLNFSCALSARVKLVTRYTTFCLVLSGYSSKFVVNQTPYKWRPLGSHTTTDINLCFGQNLYVFLARFVNRYETLSTFSRSSIFSCVEYSIYYSPFSIVVGCSVGAAVAAAEVVVVGDPEVLGANSLATYGKTV